MLKKIALIFIPVFILGYITINSSKADSEKNCIAQNHTSEFFTQKCCSGLVPNLEDKGFSCLKLKKIDLDLNLKIDLEIEKGFSNEAVINIKNELNQGDLFIVYRKSYYKNFNRLLAKRIAPHDLTKRDKRKAINQLSKKLEKEGNLGKWGDYYIVGMLKVFKSNSSIYGKYFSKDLNTNLVIDNNSFLLRDYSFVEDPRGRKVNKLGLKYKYRIEKIDFNSNKKYFSDGIIINCSNSSCIKERFIVNNLKNTNILKSKTLKEESKLSTLAVCGNGKCEAEDCSLKDFECVEETEINCPADCSLKEIKEVTSCGDGLCQEIICNDSGCIEKENIENCPIDCEPKDNCGNGVCEDIVCQALGCPKAENVENCPEDCLVQD